MWRVTDTAKAVFHVDNYKEYLSLQCDSALRNIVRIYPYDVAPNVDTTGDGIADEGSCVVPAKLLQDAFAMRSRRSSRSRSGDHRGTYHLSCLCTGDRSRYASETAGISDH